MPKDSDILFYDNLFQIVYKKLQNKNEVKVINNII